MFEKLFKKTPSSFYDAMHGLTDEKYYDMLCRSISEPVIDGIEMPGFPKTSVQMTIVGKSEKSALEEAFRFFSIVKDSTKKYGNKMGPRTKYLDFGCGWGRIARFAFKDVLSENIFGIDVDPAMVEICKSTLPCGNYSVVKPLPPTNIQDNSIDIITAFSVFSHLRKDVAEMWIEEFSRILKPGGMLVATTTGVDFIDLYQDIQDNPSKYEGSPFIHLRGSMGSAEDARNSFNNGEFVYAANGGNSDVLDGSFYGWAVVPKQYIETQFGKYLKALDYIYDHANIPQAIFVMQKS